LFGGELAEINIVNKEESIMIWKKTAQICMLLGISLLVSIPARAQEGGAFSPYLVGTYDLRDG